MCKKILSIFVLTPVLLFAAGCEGVLDLNPHDTLNPATAFQTEEDGLMALAGAYARMRNTYFNGRIYSTGGMTDDAYSQHNHFGERNVVLGNLSPSTGGIATQFYINSYQAIGTFNYFLANIDQVRASEALLNRWKAEVRFLRALYYAHLSELYGGVPIVTEPYSVGDPILPRSSKEEVVAFVLEDLDSAIQNLPDGSYDGHAVRGSAQALKARVLLANDRFAESAAVGRQIIDGNTFSLYQGEFKAMFEAAGQTDNPEIMFSVRYRAPNLLHDATRATLWWASIQPTQDFVDEFEMIDGLPITESPLYDPDNPYENRDPRLRATVLVPGDQMANEIWWVTYFGQGGNTPYNLFKPADRDVWHSEGDGARSENDPILIRYAEVLLNYAEAQNESVGPDASVYAAVNAVRARVGMPDLPPGLSQSEMRKRIRHERRVELAFEGMHRYLDLIRWREAVERLDGFQVGTVTYRFAEHNYLWPIPQSQIDFYNNHGAPITQNPGY